MRSQVCVLLATVALCSACVRETKCGSGPGAVSRQTAPVGPVKVVRVALSPPDATVFVHGERIDHPPGYVELPGPIGYVFNLALVANDARISKQVTVTANGADPPALELPWWTAMPASAPERDPVVAEMVAAQLAAKTNATHEEIPAQREAQDENELLASGLAAHDADVGLTALTIVCVPACTQIVDNGVSVGRSPLVRRATTPGRHVLKLTSSNGVTKTIVVTVAESTMHSIRVSMADGKAPETVPPARR